MSNYKYPPPPPRQPLVEKEPNIYKKEVIPEILTRISSNESDSSRKSDYGSDIFNAIMDDKNKTPRRNSESDRKSDYGSDIFNAAMNESVKNKTPTRKNSQSGSGTDLGSEIFDAIIKDRSTNTPYVPPNKRTFAKLKKEVKKAETQQRKESTPGPSYSGPRKGKGVGKMPSASNYISKKDSDEEMNS